jgi:membrane protein required for colicin V production
MNQFDIILLVLACILVVIGMVKGLVRILVGLAALVTAFVVAARYHQPLAQSLSGFDVNAGVLRIVAYILLFLGVMIVGGVLAYLARRLLKAAMLSWADRAAGAAAGLVTAFIVAALLILPIVAYAPNGDSWLRQSILAPYVAAVADLARPLVPQDLSERYRERMEDLRRFWQGELAPVSPPQA